MAITKQINIIPDDSWQRIHVSQGDIGRTLQFVLYEGSTSYTIPVGATVKIQGTKPSGLGFSETCTWSGSTVTIATTETMTSEFGGIPTEIRITDGDDVLGTSNFMLVVERNPHGDEIIDGNIDTFLPEMRLLVNQMGEYADEISTSYHSYGSPWVASTVAQMTDTDKIYVYTGSETGYVNGNWYYYNGSSWVSGGVYNAVAISTDKTLSIEDMPADSKVVGHLKNDVNDVSHRIETLDGDIYINDDDFELGNIGMSTSGWTYSSSSTRVRTKEGTTYNLQAGDVISLSNYTNARFYVGWLAKDGTYGAIGWLTNDYEVPIDGSYVLLMSNITETSQTSKDDLLSLLGIQRDDNALNDIEQLESDIDSTITVVTGTNILNQNDVNVGYLFNSSGVNIANSSYTTTPYYFLASGESVSLNLFRKFIAISTINNTVLSYIDENTTNYTYTATSDCKFKICFLTSALSTVQIEYGTSCTTYEDYYTYTQLSEVLYSSKRLFSEWYLQRNPNVLSIAHQGYNVNAPKQTLSAYEETREQGFDIAECDINCTSDGYIICCHNEIVYADTTNMVINQSLTSASDDYTTAITIADSTLATLQTYSWGAWMSSNYADETVPLFEDVLAICKKTGLKLFIDDFARAITGGYSNDVYDLIDKYGMRDNVLFVTTNNDPNLWNSEATHVISSSTYDSSVLTRLAEYIEWYPDSEIILSLNYNLIDSTVSQSVHALGVKLFAWTIDTVSDYEALLPYVDGIISNNLSYLNYYLSNRT